MENFNVTLLAFFFLSCLVTTFHASVLETQEFWEVQNKSVDEYWKQRAKTAEKANAKAAFADPYEVSANLTSNVHEILGGNKTRAERILTAKKGKGPCEAFNPIDRCWRCDPKWAKHRQRLAKCVKGFGRKTRGGRSGKIYIVTDSSDNDMVNPKAGTLRHAVIQAEPLWIIFSHSMVIRLRQELIMTSDKTIDGRGANVHIAGGAGITIQFIENVIIHGIHIHDIKPKIGGLIRDSVDHFGIRTRSDGDAISIFGSNRVWIDHCSLYKGTDGLIDAIMGSTAITISNNHFAKHNEVMLFGASDSHTGDKKMQITVAFNNFGKGLTQRMPRCRLGFFHVVNNYYTHWKMYAIGGSQNPIIVSEGNRYIAPDDQNAKQVTMRVYTQESVWKNWQWRSINDQFVNGAYFEQSGVPVIRKKLVSKLDMITAHPVTWINRLTRNAGTLKCKVGKPC